MKSLLTAFLATAAIGAALFAQDPNGPPPSDQPNQPDGQYEQGRGVARISLLNGDVSVRRGDSGDVVAAALNAPLMADDRLLTSSSARAEVQLDHANMIRIGPNAEVRFPALDTRGSQLQIAAGTVTFRILRESTMPVELDTPSVAVRPMREGTYRITVREDGTSEITVRAGEAEIDSPHGSERLDPGQTMNARGVASDPEYQVVGAIPQDEWDRWNQDRDRSLMRSHSYQYVSPDVYGAEDLDQYGQWVNDPTYGNVWQPAVAPGWAPYRYGHWVWEDYYGWTWVSYDPWGWAPYHYGRWFFGTAGWCWYPGPVYAHPYWAPAYVGFLGWGGGIGVGVGFGFGNVGWVALAPYETFHPWWGRGFYGGYRSGAFGNRTAIVNNVSVASAYRNARVNGGVIGVSAAGFGRGGEHSAFNGAQIRDAGLVHGVLPVSPDRSSLRFSNRAVSGDFPQARAQSFAGRMQTPRVDHVGFDQQQRGMQQFSRSNFSTGGFRQEGTGAASMAHGWSRFGEPIHGTTPNSQFRSSGSSNGSGSYRGGFGGAGGPVRLSPPIVSQRGSNGGGSSPRYETPRYQAPRSSAPSFSAPRGGGSGNGGGYRSAPGFSGGGRSGGGGHSSGGHSGGGGHGGGHR